MPSALPACMRALTVKSNRTEVESVESCEENHAERVLTRVGGSGSKELGDGTEKEEVEIGERGSTSVRFAQPQLPASKQEVLQLFEELKVSAIESVECVSKTECGRKGLTVNWRIGFETRMRAGPNPLKKAERPSVLRMWRIVCHMLRRFSTTLLEGVSRVD